MIDPDKEHSMATELPLDECNLNGTRVVVGSRVRYREIPADNDPPREYEATVRKLVLADWDGRPRPYAYLTLHNVPPRQKIDGRWEEFPEHARDLEPAHPFPYFRDLDALPKGPGRCMWWEADAPLRIVSLAGPPDSFDASVGALEARGFKVTEKMRNIMVCTVPAWDTELTKIRELPCVAHVGDNVMVELAQ